MIHQQFKQLAMFFGDSMEDNSAGKQKRGNDPTANADKQRRKAFDKSRFEIIDQNRNHKADSDQSKKCGKCGVKTEWLIFGKQAEDGHDNLCSVGDGV